MRALKLEWREGPHGVDSLRIIGENGSFTFVPDSSSGFDTKARPFDRTATLDAVKLLAEEILQRLAEGHHTDLT